MRTTPPRPPSLICSDDPADACAAKLRRAVAHGQGGALGQLIEALADVAHGLAASAPAPRTNEAT